MAYQKTVWKDQDVENPRTYVERDNGDGTVTLLDAFGEVTELGTPVNAANMNKIENGIEEVDNSAVHKTGDETIDGNKTFSGYGKFTNLNAFWKTPFNIIVRSESIEDGVTPSSNQFMGIEFRDKNDVRVGWIGLVTLTDGTQRIDFQNQGSTSGFATPTPPAGDNSNLIATTAFVKTAVSNTLSALYPVGSIYIGTQSTCPLATLISGSTWVKVSEGRVLQGSDSNHNAGTTIEAGLPNLSLYTPQSTIKYGSQPNTVYNVNGTSGNTNNIIGTNQPAKLYIKDDNNIVGNSTTVQPPAYVVNIWRRTA
jgi:hypothetical protein